MSGLCTYLDLFFKLRDSGNLKDYKHLCEVIISEIPDEVSQEDRDKIMEFSRNFSTHLFKRWTDANRSINTFLKREYNRNWLETDIKWPSCYTVDLKAVMGGSTESGSQPLTSIPPEIPIPSTSFAEAGTSTETEKRKPFLDLTNRQKKRRSGSILEENTEEELCYYYTSKLKANGNRALTKIVEHLSQNSELISDVSKLLFEKEPRTKIPEDLEAENIEDPLL